MDLRALIHEVGRGAHGARDLAEEDAYRLYCAMLDGGVPELELGALLIAYRIKGESVDELKGFCRALAERIAPLKVPGKALPVILPSYNGARKQPNLTPLLALMLARCAVPVLIHGVSEDFGRVTSAAILKEIGILPCASAAEIQGRLDRESIAYAPIGVLSPGLERLLGARARLGVRGPAHTVAKLLDPFGGESVRVVSVTHPDYLKRMREYLVASGANALLLRGAEGEPYANPKRQPQVDWVYEGRCEQVLAQEPVVETRILESIDAATTAAWTNDVIAGRCALPVPILRQAACCARAAGAAGGLDGALALIERSVAQPV